MSDRETECDERMTSAIHRRVAPAILSDDRPADVDGDVEAIGTTADQRSIVTAAILALLLCLAPHKRRVFTRPEIDFKDKVGKDP
jgi:hypothetical protein